MISKNSMVTTLFLYFVLCIEILIFIKIIYELYNRFVLFLFIWCIMHKRLLEERILKREGGTNDKIIINPTQKVRPRVLKSRNMMSVARTSLRPQQELARCVRVKVT